MSYDDAYSILMEEFVENLEDTYTTLFYSNMDILINILPSPLSVEGLSNLERNTIKFKISALDGNLTNYPFLIGSILYYKGDNTDVELKINVKFYETNKKTIIQYYFSTGFIKNMIIKKQVYEFLIKFKELIIDPTYNVYTLFKYKEFLLKK